ncbi:MAG: choice-of-anchor Q domain-containing protein, partial [Candidatus Marinimicrobia bacterium]|nr:choice-of-anchor Q domain-containing protein [Candidatus Neomarinimicrobiota bacterium]
MNTRASGDMSGQMYLAAYPRMAIINTYTSSHDAKGNGIREQDNIFTNADPFTDSENNDLSLPAYSAAIGSGVSSVQFNGQTVNAPTTDFYGNVRPAPDGSSPDIGAIESSRSKKLTRLYVSKEGFDTNNGTEVSPFLTISKGTSVTSGGDTVLVGPGTYSENIELVDADLHLASYYLTTGDTSYVNSTIIDGQQNGSTIWIRGSDNNNRLSNVKLTGLTITGGSYGSSGYQDGSGIRIDYGRSLTCDKVVIRDNNGNIGGGISAENLDFLTLRNTLVHSNEAENQGGGIFLVTAGKLHIENSIISNNSVNVNDGGGISANGTDTTLIINTVIAYNTIPNGRYGPGMSINNGGNDTTLIMNSIIAGNLRSNEEISHQIYVHGGRIKSYHTLYGGYLDDGTLDVDENNLFSPSGLNSDRPFV